MKKLSIIGPMKVKEGSPFDIYRGTINEVAAGKKTMVKPEITPGMESGNMILKNVLKELNVLSGEKVDRNNDTKVITNTIYENSMYTGCWYSNYKVGDIVSKGDELGTVKDYFGNILHTCIAKVDGIILYQVGSLSILKDGPMITYGEI